MSSRALRKLQQDKELENLNDEGGPSDDDVSIARPSTGARARKPNPFELLNPDSLSESEVKEDDDQGPSEISLSALQINKRKRKNKKKKPKNIPNKSSEDNLEDEVEKSVREVNKLLGEAEAPNENSEENTSSRPQLVRSLLSVEPKNLNPENEMKRIFGSKVVLGEHANRGGGHRRGHRQRAHRTSHWLVVPKPSWPQPGKTGLAMKFLESDRNSYQYFTFEHSSNYQLVQKRFFHAVESLNPEHIIQLLNEHPFHIDAMLQLSDICKMGEDSARAAELIERTLYAMEAAFHPLFNLAVGTCRLDYKRQENRAFFIAIFRHIHYIGARACHRTALEFCKLALSLDPLEDPLGILLMMDFYALRSQQYSWFLEFLTSWDPKRNLTQLPNMAYSMALAQFYSSKNQDFAMADHSIQKALIEFPGVFLPLMDKCSVEIDKRVLGSPFFLDAQSKQPTALQLLTSLYVGRSFHIWKDASILPWLERNVNTVLDMVDAMAPIINDCAERRQTRYQGTPRNIFRHVILSDIKDASTSLPRDISDVPIMSYDPLPPLDSIDTYSRSGPGRSSNLDDPSILGMFFRSLLPNFNPNDPNPPDLQLPEGAAAPEGTGDLRSSVTNLLDAMQNLLGGLHLPELPQDADASEDSDDDADWQ